MTKIKYLSTSTAAAKLGVTAAYIRQLCANGTIKAEKVGHDWLINEKDLKSFKRQRRNKKDLYV